ncbi:MAG: hypothetical protein ACLR6J_10375 [Parabacteroides merdae]
MEGTLLPAESDLLGKWDGLSFDWVSDNLSIPDKMEIREDLRALHGRLV